MKEEEIKRQLKLSKQQNKNERYDYLCSQFNCVNYAIKLEKYTNKLQQENKRLQDKLNKVSQEIDDILVFDDFSDTTHGIGNVKEELKFYLSDCETLDEFRKLEKGDTNE